MMGAPPRNFGQTTLQDPLRVPRRQMDPEDFLDIARRNKSWIAGPALAGLVLAVITAFLWPDTYVSTAVVRVQPPQVPESFVRSNVTSALAQRISLMSQTILSRSNLTSIVETYGLYPRQRQTLPMEDIIERMRRNVVISEPRAFQPGRGNTLTAFRISFSYENRYLAQKVAADVTSRFITENTRERAYQSAVTTQFLKDQWQAAKNALDAIEQKLTEFRVRNAGQLPDQWSANVQQLSAFETRISTLNAELSRMNQEKLMAEADIRAKRDRMEVVAKAPAGLNASYADPRLARYEEQIRIAERNLAGLLDSYTTNHPDVRRYRTQIELLRKERDELVASIAPKEQAAGAAGPFLTSAQASELRSLQEETQRAQMLNRTRDMAIEQAQKEIESVKSRVAAIQHRIEVAPVGEQEYMMLLRDYEFSKNRYEELNLKMSQSELASDLESRKQGELLELLDPASLPETPTQPVRWAIVLLGLFGGIGAGGGIAFLREMKDTTLKTLKDVRAYTQLTVLTSIPQLENDLVVLRRRRMAWLAWTTAFLFSVMAMAGSIYYYYATKV